MRIANDRMKVTFTINKEHDYMLEVLALLTGAHKSEILRDILDDAVEENRELLNQVSKL